MIQLLQRVSEGAARRWCYAFHPAPMWPVRGMYQCPRCQRKYPVLWEKKDAGLPHPAKHDPYAPPVFTVAKDIAGEPVQAG